MLRAAGSGPDSPCDLEQVSSLEQVFLGLCFPASEMGPPVRTPQGCQREGRRLWQRLRAAAPNYWLPSPRHARPHHLGAQRAGAAVPAEPPARGRRREAPEARPPRPRAPARPPPSPEPRPPSDGGAAPGNGALATQHSGDPTRPRRPRGLSQATRRAPTAAAGTSAAGPIL